MSVKCTVKLKLQMYTVKGGVQSPLHSFLHEEGGDEGGCPALTVRRGALSGEQRHLVFDIQTTWHQNHTVSPEHRPKNYKDTKP
jgi:hypothetical protein